MAAEIVVVDSHGLCAVGIWFAPSLCIFVGNWTLHLFIVLERVMDFHKV
jgi:hypothetical protein